MLECKVTFFAGTYPHHIPVRELNIQTTDAQDAVDIAEGQMIPEYRYFTIQVRTIR